MKRLWIYLTCLSAVYMFSSAKSINTGEPRNEPLIVNESNIPEGDLKMLNIDKSEKSLSELKQENGLLVIFSANSCPFVIGTDKSEGWEQRYDDMYAVAKENKVGMVLINSNHAKRDGKDSFENMISHASEMKYQWPYLLDENHKIADAFAARTTPHVFLFNSQGTLVYKGAIDDNVNDSKKVKKHYLKNALESVAQGAEISPNKTRNIGCSIKRFSYSHE